MVKGVKRAGSFENKVSKKAKVSKDLPTPASDSESEDIVDSSGDEKVESSEEEDELDELDDLDNENDSHEQDKEVQDESEDEDVDKPVDPNKKSSKEQHQEQREILAKRKLQRKAGIEVQKIKNLWEKLRVTKPAPTKQIRDKLCDEIWELSRDVLLDLVMKHDASRVVQTLIKYSSKTRRDQIVVALKGNYYQLATSSYGKYLLIKLLHYGSKESRTLIIDELHGKLRKLMRHKEGAYVVEDLYVLYSTAEQKHQMIREFWGSEYAVFKDSGKGKNVVEITHESSEKKQLIMTNLFGTISASVDKGSTGFQILHAAMKEYVSILIDDIEANDKQIRDFIEILQEQFAELVHTQEGSDVASTLIALANAKERKLIIKSLKPHNTKLISNEYGNIVLITLYMTVDDTVLLHKSFNQDLFTENDIPEIIKAKFSRRPLLYLLNGLDGKYFSPLIRKDLKSYEELAYKKTTKKPQEQRKQELLSKALPLIYKGVLSTTAASHPEGSFASLLSVNIASQFISELILTPTDVEEVNNELRPQLLSAIFDVTIKGDILEDFHIINKAPFASRALKSLIQGNEFRFNLETKQLEPTNEDKIPGVGTEFAIQIAEQIIGTHKLLDWANSQGSFVIVALYEVLKLSDAKVFKILHKELKKNKSELDADNKGSQLLLKFL